MSHWISLKNVEKIKEEYLEFLDRRYGIMLTLEYGSYFSSTIICSDCITDNRLGDFGL